MSDILLMSRYIDEVFEKQDFLNTIICDEWHKQRSGLDFLLATVDEFSEYIKHMSFEWWKANTPNESEAKTEIVDMWFFVISAIILKYHTDNSCLNTYWISRIKKHVAHEITHCDQKPNPQKALEYGAAVLSEMKEFVFSNRFTGEGKARKLITTLIKMSYAAGLTGDTLFIEYMSKLQLNIFRQKNGYKDGSYIKIWGDKEDNVVLKEVVELYVSILYNSGNIYQFNDMVMTDMHDKYVHIKKREEDGKDPQLLQE